MRVFQGIKSVLRLFLCGDLARKFSRSVVMAKGRRFPVLYWKKCGFSRPSFLDLFGSACQFLERGFIVCVNAVLLGHKVGSKFLYM